MNFFDLVKGNDLSKLLLEGHFGLEKENLRVDKYGNLAITPHPKIFGDKGINPYITTDFAEAQIEMVTKICNSTVEVANFMEVLHDIISINLDGEYLWPYSIPAVLPEENKIKIAQFNEINITQYREYLAKKYGKLKQLLSGIHYNFSFTHKLINTLYEVSHKPISYREFNDNLYMKVARGYLKYSWLVIYLFGASSVAHKTYMPCCKCSFTKINNDTYSFNNSSSFRNGINGYRNNDYFDVSYNSLTDYIKDIQQAIDDHKIISAKEYYSQIRLKGHSLNSMLDNLSLNGINYLEIRAIDLNPLTKIGFTVDQLDFLHLLLIYCLLIPELNMDKGDYQLVHLNQILAADNSRNEPIMLHIDSDTQKPLRLWGVEIIQDMRNTFMSLGINRDELLSNFENQLLKNVSNADVIAKHLEVEGYAKFFMGKAHTYLEESHYKYKKHDYVDGGECIREVLLTLS